MTFQFLGPKNCGFKWMLLASLWFCDIKIFLRGNLTSGSSFFINSPQSKWKTAHICQIHNICQSCQKKWTFSLFDQCPSLYSPEWDCLSLEMSQKRGRLLSFLPSSDRAVFALWALFKRQLSKDSDWCLCGLVWIETFPFATSPCYLVLNVKYPSVCTKERMR